MREQDTVDFLAGVPLLAGREPSELTRLAVAIRGRSLREGTILWRQGEEAREMLIVVEGGLSATLNVPGGRAVEVSRAGPGDTVGETGLLDGEGHTTNMRVTEPTRVLALSKLDFHGLLAGRDPSAFALKRRLALLLATRLRAQLLHLALSLGADVTDSRATPRLPPPAKLQESPAPDSRYIRRMTTFHQFEPLALWGFLTSGGYVRCPSGRLLLAALLYGRTVAETPDLAAWFTFGGPDLKTLYITAGKTLFSIRVKIPGFVIHRPTC